MRGLTWDHPRGIDPLRAASELWARQGGTSTVWQARSLTAFGDSDVTEVARIFDLLVIDHPHVGIAAEAQCLVPFGALLEGPVLDELAGQSAGPSHASYHYAGEQWALAADSAVQVSSYRSDLLAAQLPTTWPGVLEFAQQLREAGRWMAVPLVPGDCICCFLTLMASFGEPLAAGNAFPLDTAGAALGFLRELVAVAHPMSLRANPIAVYDAMSTADEIAYCPLAFGYTNYSRAGFRSRALSFTDLPLPRRGLLGGAGIAVSRWATNPAEAARFAAWLCSAETQRTLYCTAGGQPGNLAAWQDPVCNAMTRDFFTATLATLRSAYVRPTVPDYLPWQVASGNHIHDFLSDRMTLKACLDVLATTFNRLTPSATQPRT